MARPVQAIVVGAGLMGRWHAHAIRRVGSVVCGVVDADPTRAAALAAGHRKARPFDRLEAALAALPPDIVHICTPPDTHVALVRTALAAGCHVLAEKPLAPTAAETQALLELADAAGRLLIPVHQFPWQRGSRELVRRLASLGPVVHLEAATASAGASAAGEGGADAIASDILPHFLALTRALLRANLAELRWTVEKPRAGEWRVAARCGTATIHYIVSMTARPTFAELRLLGERGSARLDLFHGFAVFEAGTVSRMAKLARPFALAARSLLAASCNLARRALLREPAYPGLTELVRRAHLALRGLGEDPVGHEETLDIARARDRLVALAAAFDRSALEGQPRLSEP